MLEEGATYPKPNYQPFNNTLGVVGMASDRVFLGWERPFLPAAAEWLFRRDAPQTLWDLSGEVLVVPGSRARRRLLELLVTCAANGGSVEEAGGAAGGSLGLIPPQIVTLGELPELLYPAASQDPLRALLALVQVLQQTPPATLSRWCPQPPEADDLTGWTALAGDLLRLDAELAGAGLRFADVAERCRTADLSFSDRERWTLLAELHRRYLERLRVGGLEDRQEARRRALDEKELHAGTRVTLLATTDLNPLTRRMLRQSEAEVLALVYAPESESAGFDELGALAVDAWADAPLPLDRTALRIVERPRDQALAVVEELAELGERFGPDQVTVGLGDSTLGPGVERALELCGVRARPAVGRELSRTRPALLLEALVEFSQEQRADRLAALLRHPDLSLWLSKELSRTAPGTAERWLIELDQYLQEHLPLRLGAEWSGDARERTVLEAAVQAVCTLIDIIPTGTRALSAWPAPIASVLGLVYGVRDWQRQVPDDAAVIEALEEIGAVLRKLAALGPEHPLAPEVTVGTAVRFILGQLAGKAVPLPADPGAVELLGWLELPLDDAPALVVTGLNEGSIPESVNADAFLPDRLRRELGLLDNRRRYARDVLALRTMVESRQHLTLISGRRGAAGDPLLPSRLLFACDDRTLVQRVLQFYAGEESSVPARPLLPSGNQCAFLLPRPEPPALPLDRLRVTAFADYLACPYRFYLKHVRKLRSPDDAAVELDPLLFGNVVHGALLRFGSSELRTSTDVAAIRSFLTQALEEELQARFGRQRLPAVELQSVQLRRRLEQFAEWQARHAAEGWEISLVEREVEALLPSIDAEFRVYGRIDRIDRHPDGRWLLLDYKSGETARTPDQQHRSTRDGQRRWVNLQLPLYRRLAEHGLNVQATQISVGYVCLPKETPKGGLLQLGSWTPEELDEADAAARQVIGGVRSGTFWPPGEPPRYPDGLQGVCADRSLDREGLISRSLNGGSLA